jgi:general secretion pathway protein H
LTPQADISQAQNCSPSKTAGFSLLEILAALVIIGLMSAAVVLSLKPPDNSQTKFRDRLVLTLNQAAKESVYTGRVNALSVSAEGLHIMTYREGAWSVVQDFPALTRSRMTLQIERENIELPKIITPLILFEPTGDMTDFELNLRGSDMDINLFSAPDGSILIGDKA